MARCAVPVAERSVKRRNRMLQDVYPTTFIPPYQTGTPQRGIPTIALVNERIDFLRVYSGEFVV